MEMKKFGPIAGAGVSKILLCISATACKTRMHSSSMHIARSLPYGGVSVHGGLFPGASLFRGSLSREISVQGDLCPRRSLSGVCVLGGVLSGGLCLGGDPPGQRPFPEGTGDKRQNVNRMTGGQV